MAPKTDPKPAEARIREKLMTAFEPIRLDVVNESELHAGHRSSPGTGESHFRLLIVSPKFAGCSRLERHRMINAALAGEMTRIHALAIAAFAPGEPIRVYRWCGGSSARCGRRLGSSRSAAGIRGGNGHDGGAAAWPAQPGSSRFEPRCVLRLR